MRAMYFSTPCGKHNPQEPALINLTMWKNTTLRTSDAGPAVLTGKPLPPDCAAAVWPPRQGWIQRMLSF